MRSALALAALACLSSGCATIVRGSTETVTVDADRDSAFVFVDGVAAGVTPARLEMVRSRDHRVEVVRVGHRVARDTVERRFNPAVAAGSFLLGRLGGLGVDVSSGAVYDLRPSELWVTLVPDSAGVEAEAVSDLVQRAQEAALDGFPRPEPARVRRAPPWVTAQIATGAYIGGVPGSDRDASTGGIGASLLAGIRGGWYSARLSATGASGFLFDNSERWELAALVGGVVEAADGKVRLGLSAGPGWAGGRDNSVCFLCSGPRRERTRLPTRVGLSVLGEVYVFPSPHVGLGLQFPVNIRSGDVLSGVMLGWRFEGV